MEQVEQPTSKVECDSPVDGVTKGQSPPRTDLKSVQIPEETIWMAAQEGETASSDCGGVSDLQGPGSVSGEEVEGSETSDATGLEVSPGSKEAWVAKNGDRTLQESPQQNSDTSVTAQTFSGKNSKLHF